MKIIVAALLALLLGVSLTTAEISKTNPKGPLLRSFDGFKYDVERGPDGVYKFLFHVGDSSRKEERESSGLVKGEYAFVAPEGEEYEFKYEADKKGFRVDSNALPVKPEETDEVKKAREDFFEEYNKALERAKTDSYEDEEESEESDEESSEEDDDEEESYSIFAYGGGKKDDAQHESSEESSEEGDDEEDEEEEEEVEEEEKKEEEKKGDRKAENTKKQSVFKAAPKPAATTSSLKADSSSAFSHFGLRTAPLLFKRRKA